MRALPHLLSSWPTSTSSSSGVITTGCIDDTSSAIYRFESYNQGDAGVFLNDEAIKPWTKCTALQMDATTL